MIDSRDGYRYVVPPEGIAIDGGILPARDVEGGGEWKSLRGEDVCFLAEAAHRARLYRTYGAQIAPPSVSSAILRGVVNAARGNIVSYPSFDYNLVKYCFAGEPQLRGGYVKDVGATALEQIGSVLYNGSELYAPVSTADVNGDLVADDIRRMYYDLRKSGLYVYGGSLSRKFYGSIVTDYKKHSYSSQDGFVLEDEQIGYPSDESRVIGLSKYTSTWGGQDLVCNWTVTAVPPSFGQSVTQLAPLHGTDVECYVVFLVSVTFGAAGEDSQKYMDAIVKPGVVGSEGVVEISPLTASSVRDAVSAARDIPVAWGDLKDNESASISVDPSFVVFYDPDIDTSEIEWEWEPPSAE